MGPSQGIPPENNGRMTMARPASIFAYVKDQQQRDQLTKLWKEHPNSLYPHARTRDSSERWGV